MHELLVMNPPSAEEEERAPSEAACWMGAQALVLFGAFGGRDPSVRLAIGDAHPTPVSSAFLPLVGNESDAATHGLLVVELPPRDTPPGVGFALEIDVDDRAITVSQAALAAIELDVRGLLREYLGWLPSEARAEVIAFLAGAVRHRAGSTATRRLAEVREALRERLPPTVLHREHPQGMFCDRLLALDDRCFYIEGWVRDADAPVSRLTAVSPEGLRVELLDAAFRFERDDVRRFYGNDPFEPARDGFLSFFELPGPSHLEEGWLLETVNADGTEAEYRMPTAVTDPLTARDSVLADLGRSECDSEEFMRSHAAPALQRLQERFTAGVGFSSVRQYGVAPGAPDVSVIVPLYGRIDLIEQQLASFADDPELHASDLIYVLDSPELAAALTSLAPHLHAIYRIPFRVAVLERNVGFSGVNNAGATLARGRLLVLLNSDVLAERTGWIGALQAFHDATEGVGAVGPKLLFDDGSLQHAGMYFHRIPEGTLWANGHRFKGMHGSLPAANVAQPVAAVTGACLMVSAALYRDVGGLSGDYVQGDYEDSDLCLRLLQRGLRSWYLPSAELYHLEGRSYTPARRRVNSRFNMWLQTERWGELIERLASTDADKEATG